MLRDSLKHELSTLWPFTSLGLQIRRELGLVLTSFVRLTYTAKKPGEFPKATFYHCQKTEPNQPNKNKTKNQTDQTTPGQKPKQKVKNISTLLKLLWFAEIFLQSAFFSTNSLPYENSISQLNNKQWL